MGKLIVKMRVFWKKLCKLIIKLIFRAMKKIPIKNNYIVLDSWKGQSLKGNLLEIFKELSKNLNFKIILIGDNIKYKNINTIICKSRSLKHMYYLSVSKYWIVDTMYYEYFKPRKETKYILIWHASGAFKRFGISTLNNCKELINIYRVNGENLTNLIISSDEIKDIYAKELAIDEEKIIALGLPRTDEFINDRKSYRDKICFKYNIDKKRKIILYAPTFRGEGISKFDFKLDVNLIKDYVIILKLHPNNYLNKEDENINVIISKNDKLEELMKASDCLITDYSSIIFEYCLLKKPMFFYAYDLQDYMHNERGFYCEYNNFIPGPLSYNTQELIDQINNYNMENYINKINYIADKYQLHDGNCTKRFMEKFFGINN